MTPSPPAPLPLPVAVLVSGGGTNLQALFDALRDARAARVTRVISSRPDAGALERARRAGALTTALADPASADEVLTALGDARLVVLAGYVKRIPPAVVARFRWRLINIHPALLPAFGGAGMYGRRVHAAVIASGAAVSGATVHYVDDGRTTRPSHSPRGCSRWSTACCRPWCWSWRGGGRRRCPSDFPQLVRLSSRETRLGWNSNKADRRIGGWADRAALLTLLLSAYPAIRLTAQTVDQLALRFTSWTAVTGFERAVTDSLVALLPGGTRDRFGNVIVTLGRGSPRRLASCDIDEPGYVVGNITDDGYLRLRRVPGALLAPLQDQMLEGHRVTLFGEAGPVPAVVAVRSTHLARFRAAAAEAPFTVDDAFVDVGAASRVEAERLGLHVLTPVALTKRPLPYGDRLLAAPRAGERVGCAALAAAVLGQSKVRGTVVVAFAVQSLYASKGAHAVAALHGPFDATAVALLDARYHLTPVETVSLAAADSLRRALMTWMEGR